MSLDDYKQQYLAARCSASFDEYFNADFDWRQAWQTLGAAALPDDRPVASVAGEARFLPLPFDHLPLALELNEWRQLEVGVCQRVRLLEALMQDIYGARQLVTAGLLPAEFLYAHPEFWRPCHDIPLARHPFAVVGVDVARNADGSWMALGQRVEGSSGIGYALFNRLTAEQPPTAVQSIEPFFKQLQDFLGDAGQQAALLTPGSFSPAYFEQVFLANYLGLPLLRGDDLRVKNRLLQWQTVGGSLPVDTLWRQVDSGYCDPLELNPNSFLGMAGLTEAARQGWVRVTNPLGAGVLDSPAIQAFLPDICEFLLEESLILPGVPTWWCGFEDHLEYALDNLADLVIRPLSRMTKQPPVFGSLLETAEREQWQQQIRSNPAAYAIQEPLNLSQIPVQHEQGWRAARCVLRTFSQVQDQQVSIMPGGLVRATGENSAFDVSIAAGGISKDCWIIDPAISADAVRPILEIQRPQLPLSGKQADTLYWMARYAQRQQQALSLWLAVLQDSLRGRAVKQYDQYLLALLTRQLYLTEFDDGLSPAETKMRLVDLLVNIEQPKSLLFQWDYFQNTLQNLSPWHEPGIENVLRRMQQQYEALGKITSWHRSRLLNRVEQLHALNSALLQLLPQHLLLHPGRAYFELGQRIEGLQLLLRQMQWVLPQTVPLKLISHLLSLHAQAVPLQADDFAGLQCFKTWSLNTDNGALVRQLRALAQVLSDLPGQSRELSTLQTSVTSLLTHLEALSLEWQSNADLLNAIRPVADQVWQIADYFERNVFHDFETSSMVRQ